MTLEYVRNILSVFARATQSELQFGLSWYQDAHAIALKLSSVINKPVSHGAAIIAALSPRASWDANIIASFAVIDSDIKPFGLPVLPKNYAKAVVIRDCDTVLDSMVAVTPRSYKARKFYRCILEPTVYDGVCVDRHAHNIAVYGCVRVRNNLSIVGRRYLAIEQSYKVACGVLNACTGLKLLPSQLQAITWLTYRNMK